MRMHLALDVRDVSRSVAFYERVFGVKPQKQTGDYAKFDVQTPVLNLALVSSTGDVSVVNHLGIEVDSIQAFKTWRDWLEKQGLIEKREENVHCCFARQDKLWFTDPDGNAWEVFFVHEQFAVAGSLKSTGCCVPKDTVSSVAGGCGVSPLLVSLDANRKV